MKFDRNTRPDTHVMYLTAVERDELLAILEAAGSECAMLALRLREAEQGSDGRLVVGFPEAERIPAWRAAYAARSELAEALKDFHLIWPAVAQPVAEVLKLELVPGEFWRRRSARYRIPGGLFYDQPHYDEHHPTAPVHDALLTAFVQKGYGTRRQSGARHFFDWATDMWVHDHPARRGPRWEVSSAMRLTDSEADELSALGL